MRMKMVRTSFSESYESFSEGHLEAAIDELREKSDMDIASFKAMLEAAYKDKVSSWHQKSLDEVTPGVCFSRSTSSKLREAEMLPPSLN